MQESYGHGLTDKENSTCNAFEHLAVDGGPFATTPTYSKTDRPSVVPKSTGRGDVSSTLRSSSDVRSGLIALLDTL